MRTTVLVVVALVACAAPSPETVYAHIGEHVPACAMVGGATPPAPVDTTSSCATGGSVIATGSFDGRIGAFGLCHLAVTFAACHDANGVLISGMVEYVATEQDVGFEETLRGHAAVRDGGDRSCEIDTTSVTGGSLVTTVTGTVCGESIAMSYD